MTFINEMLQSYSNFYWMENTLLLCLCEGEGGQFIHVKHVWQGIDWQVAFPHLSCPRPHAQQMLRSCVDEASWHGIFLFYKWSLRLWVLTGPFKVPPTCRLLPVPPLICRLKCLSLQLFCSPSLAYVASLSLNHFDLPYAQVLPYLDYSHWCTCPIPQPDCKHLKGRD